MFFFIFFVVISKRGLLGEERVGCLGLNYNREEGFVSRDDHDDFVELRNE